MLTELIDRNEDLKRLREEGYNIEIRDGNLLVRDVPYVTARGEIARGTLLTPLTTAGDKTVRPKRHTVMFTGEYPHSANGEPIKGIECGDRNERVEAGLTVCYDFSARKVDASGNKVPYDDHYEKMTYYVRRLSHPAATIDPGATAQTYKVSAPPDDDSPFEYIDTASARSGITEMQRRLRGCRLGIIGIGGTGSYILDLLAKTPVKEIHLFDDDVFLTHNAFRSPGPASIDELRSRPFKVEYFQKKYSVQKRKIVAHCERIDESNLDLLSDLDFVFVCLHSGNGKEPIVTHLEGLDIPFIDVGLGITSANGMLRGSIRTTASTSQMRKHVRQNARFSLEGEPGEDEYSRNTQIAELNSLNATLAVIKWKKIMGFYLDQANEHHSIYRVGLNRILNEDSA